MLLHYMYQPNWACDSTVMEILPWKDFPPHLSLVSVGWEDIFRGILDFVWYIFLISTSLSKASQEVWYGYVHGEFAAALP
jgi:hypothetical protein